MSTHGGLPAGSVNFDSFKRAIFAMIDRDGSRSIDASELKAALRSSGAITRMYDDSLRTFGLLIAATLAFDAGVFFTLGGTAAFDCVQAASRCVSINGGAAQGLADVRDCPPDMPSL